MQIDTGRGWLACTSNDADSNGAAMELRFSPLPPRSPRLLPSPWPKGVFKAKQSLCFWWEQKPSWQTESEAENSGFRTLSTYCYTYEHGQRHYWKRLWASLIPVHSITTVVERVAPTMFFLGPKVSLTNLLWHLKLPWQQVLAHLWKETETQAKLWRRNKRGWQEDKAPSVLQMSVQVVCQDQQWLLFAFPFGAKSPFAWLA